MSKNEYKDKCSDCGGNGNHMFARIFPTKINGEWKWLCEKCWDIRNKNQGAGFMLFTTGLASTPHSILIKCMKTGKIIEEIVTSKPSGRDTRQAYESARILLTQKYNHLLNHD